MSKTVLSIGAAAVAAVTARSFCTIFFVARLHFNFRQFIFQSLILPTLKHCQERRQLFHFLFRFFFHSPSFCFITFENAGFAAL